MSGFRCRPDGLNGAAREPFPWLASSKRSYLICQLKDITPEVSDMAMAFALP